VAERKRPATASAAPGAEKRTNWVNVVTVVSAVILVGAEVFGVAIAAGWAIAGLFELGTEVGYVLMALFSLFGAYALWAFYKRAVEIEPISDRA
jgi:membrane protein implicated in regulation of membrane protease activity